MQPINYDEIAAGYDRRYATNDFAGIEACLSRFLGRADSIAELGCGTGHWLRLVRALPQSPVVVGLDRSRAMLERARPDSLLIQGSADHLPWAGASFDHVFCINALHHFLTHDAVFREAACVLADSGAFMTIGLDPHSGHDQWWIYDYFPAALNADRRRYPPTDRIREQLRRAGFAQTETILAQHIPAQLAFDDAEARGVVDRHSTSQLVLLDDADWTEGLARLQRERPVLRADLHLYATIGTLD